MSSAERTTGVGSTEPVKGGGAGSAGAERTPGVGSTEPVKGGGAGSAGAERTHSPYLSVVATARNDNHGGDLLYRMQLFIDGLVAQCERHGLAAELIVVEWNPPEDRPRLAEVLRLPVSSSCPIRIIEVPNSVHSRLEHSDRLPLFQMIAKNVGIRRARGKFVLATNVDVIFSDKLMAFLASGRLDPKRVYRCDRYDVTADIPADAPVEEQLHLCEERVIRINHLEGTVDVRNGVYYPVYARHTRLPWWVALTLFTIDFAWRRVVRLARRAGSLVRHPGRRIARFARFVRRHTVRLARRAGSFVRHPTRRFARAIRTGELRFEGTFRGRWRRRDDYRARWRPRSEHYRARIEAVRKAWAWERAQLRLHTNASGDFTLMSRQAWASLEGYAELELFSMHIDGLLLYQAHYARIRERDLPYRVYHLEHTSGFKPEPADLRALNMRLEKAAVPQVTMEQFKGWAMEMFHTKQPILFNDADWGFAREELPEVATAAPLVLTETAARG